MLEFLRNGVRTWYFKALLGLLVLSFAIWGVGDIFRPGLSGNTVVKVGNIEIGSQQFTSALQRQMQNLSRTLGSNFTLEQARGLQVPERVVEGLVTEALHESEANALGIAVGKNALVQRIRSEPGFRNQEGQFDRSVYKQTLAINGFSEEQFVSRLRQELSRAQVLGSLTSEVPVSEVLTNRLYSWNAEKRVAAYIKIQHDAIANIGMPDDAALQEYYKGNESLFTAPEYRSATYVHLTGKDVESDIDVSDADIQKLYDQNIDAFKVPERRTVQQMIFSTEEEAKAGAAHLAEGKTFAAVAKDLLRQDEDATNILGDVTKNHLPDTLAEAVFNLSEGQVTPPLEGPFGWYVMRVTAIKAPKTQQLLEVRIDIRAQLVQERSGEALYKLSNDLDDALGGGASLEEAARQVGVVAKKVNKVDRGSNGSDEKPMTDLPPGPEFLTTLFNTPDGQESELVDLGVNGYLILRNTGIQAAKVKPLESVRNRAIKFWKAEQRRKQTEENSKRILERIKGGEPLEVISKSIDVPIETSPPFNRHGEGAANNLPRSLAAELFGVKVGGASSAPSDSGYTIGVLKEIVKAKVGANSADVKALAEQLAQRIGRDLEVQYNNALRQHHNVEIDQRALDNLLSQF